MIKIKILNVIERLLSAKFKLVMIVLMISIFSIGYNVFSLVNNTFFNEPEVQNVTIDVTEDIIREVFRVVALEIESTNTSVLETIPRGFLNPGIVTFLLEYESMVQFGVRDPQRIHMRRVGDFIFVDESSINIEVTSASVRNFRRVGTFRTNPLVRINENVIEQIFEAQRGYEATAAERLNNEHNIETARRNFMSTFEAVCRGLGLTVIWE